MGGPRKPTVHKKAKKLDGPRSEINVTPLVDVCLVLLIIFMVIMPLLARGKEVPLPKTRHHTEDSDKNQPIVAIDKDGVVYYDKDEVTRVVPAPPPPGQQGRFWRMEDQDAVSRAIEDGWRRAEESASEDQEPVGRKVFVKADESLPYGQVYPLIMAVHETGINAIDLGTNEIRGEAAGEAAE